LNQLSRSRFGTRWDETLPKPVNGKEQKAPGTMNNRSGQNTAFQVGLAFCFLASCLVIVEGITLILSSPLPYATQFLSLWGGYINLLFGVFILIGFLAVTFHHKRETVKTAGAFLAAIFSIFSFILFGGGFYAGFILGLFGALLTAARD
jgi:hypothetical protein